MILRLEFVAEENIELPKSYNHILQGFFYKNMPKIISHFIHDVGFAYGKRRFRLFTFSKVIGKLLKKAQGKVVYEPKITLYFASPFAQVVSSSAHVFIKKESFFLDSNKLYLASVEAINPPISTTIKVRCLSPITVYKTPIGEKRFVYLSPWEEEFYRIIKQNLLKKYEIVYNKSYDGVLEIKPVELKKSYKKKVVYKGTLIVAWEGYYELSASQEMLKLALEAGLGARNSQGFGMVEVVSHA
ncbi:MAG: CRISPR-associated endoribonuclease Cas6 [Aquificota bacterium]|nr:MAG: CRISPR-associated endoribonuclease Cas6 [Aquificota bacterium]